MYQNKNTNMVIRTNINSHRGISLNIAFLAQRQDCYP